MAEMLTEKQRLLAFKCRETVARGRSICAIALDVRERDLQDLRSVGVLKGRNCINQRNFYDLNEDHPVFSSESSPSLRNG